jgi:hypothetical protein
VPFIIFLTYFLQRQIFDTSGMQVDLKS